jgi:septum formation inhibitor-activating ATPase MinD
MSRLTAVEILELKLLGIVSFDSEVLRNKYKEQFRIAKKMEKEQSQNYAIFAIRCDRTEMRILEFNDYIKLEENENK